MNVCLRRMLPSDVGIRNGRQLPSLGERSSPRRGETSNLDYRGALPFVTYGAGVRP